MDQLMVDITEIDVKYGDEVILIGEHYTADDMAKDIGTIGYEIECGISKRVPRRYLIICSQKLVRVNIEIYSIQVLR